jgi:hypothetical protein
MTTEKTVKMRVRYNIKEIQIRILGHCWQENMAGKIIEVHLSIYSIGRDSRPMYEDVRGFNWLASELEPAFDYTNEEDA